MNPSIKAKTKFRRKHRESICPYCGQVCRVPYNSERAGWPPRNVCAHYTGDGAKVTYFRKSNK